jgi:hypothetical protein
VKPALDSELKSAAARIDQAAFDNADAETGEIIEADLPGHDDEPEDEGFPGDRPSSDQRAEPAVLTWGRDFLAWIPSAQGKALTEAWAEAKREGKPAALQNLDADLFDAVIAAKDKRFMWRRSSRSRAPTWRRPTAPAVRATCPVRGMRRQRRIAAGAHHDARQQQAAGEGLTNFGDISQVSASELPPVDIIAAGFPCQDFSIAGLRASLGGGAAPFPSLA